MAAIVSVHSFRGGTGKSNTTANVAGVLAAQGMRVGVIDGDIQSPGIHVLFGVAGDEIGASLNDFLWKGRDLADVALDVTGNLDGDRTIPDGALCFQTWPGTISGRVICSLRA